MVYTSIQTTPGWSDNAVKAAYSLKFAWALRHGKIFEPFVDFQPQQVPQPGSSITVNLNNYYTSADVIAATTPLTEESDVVATKLPATTPVTFTPKEYGFANEWTIKLAKRGLTPVDPVIANAVAAHCKDTLDYLVQTQFRAGSNVTRPAGRAATNTIVQNVTDYYKATMVRQAVTALRSRAAQPRDGQFFGGVLHPNAIHDLREETGSGSWRVPKEYGTDQSDIWNGEFGEFEGVRWVSSATVYRAADNDGSTSTQVLRGFVFGKEAVGKAVISEATTVLSPVIDKLQRFRGLGWKADLDYALYRGAALQRLEGSSSIASVVV
jgi:N4-gp56 family major capsid protein